MASLIDWKKLEEVYVKVTHRAILDLVANHPEETFYAVAFHLLYAELGGQIWLPKFGANSVSARNGYDDEDEKDYWSKRWCPADWKYAELELPKEELSELEKALNEEACKDSEEHWDDTFEQFIDVLVQVSKRLYELMKDEPWVTDEFIVFYYCSEYGPERSEDSIPEELYLKLFFN